MEINIELAKKIISKEYFINGDGGIRTQNPIYLNHLAFLMEKYHQEQLSIAAVSERKLPHWVRPLIAIVTMSLSTLFVIYRVFYVC